MKHIKKITEIAFLSIFLLFAVAPIVSAATDYTLLAPLPGTSKTSENCTTECKTDLEKYLPGAFNLTVGIAAALAFIMIIFGGITYAISDSISGKEDGRKYVTNAVTGLVLVIGAYAILYTINPQILKFNLTIKRPKIDLEATIEAGGKAKEGYKLTRAQIDENEGIKKSLSEAHVNVNAGPCINGETRGCTNLVGLPGGAIAQVIHLKEECDCGITISGGTEGGHITHGQGVPVMDIQKNPNLDAYIKKHAFGEPRMTSYGPVYSVTVGGAGVEFLDEGANEPGSTGAHWHVRF